MRKKDESKEHEEADRLEETGNMEDTIKKTIEHAEHTEYAGPVGQTENVENADHAEYTKNEEDWLWLCAIPELIYKEKMVLLHYFGSPGAVRKAGREALADWERFGMNWVQKVYPCMTDAFLEQVKTKMQKSDVHFISHVHPDFPKRLKGLADCPYGLFYKGRLPATAPVSVGIVGARACTAYGSMFARQIAQGLTRIGVQVISGMAMGIDGYAQLSAVENGGTSYAVLGCGPDICYPRSNINLYMEIQKKGGLISEYPCGTPGMRHHFPARNRILSGLCDALVVIEAGEKSGSLITANHALEQGRDVYALPGRVSDPLSAGCNRLISVGAGVILSPEGFVQEIMELYPDRVGVPAETNAPLPKLTEEEKKVYDKLSYTPQSMETLTKLTGLKIGQIISCLLQLQLKDLAAEVGKNGFVRQK